MADHETLDAFLAKLKEAGLPWTLGTCTGGFYAVVGYCTSGEKPFTTPLLALRAALTVARRVPQEATHA